MYSKNFNSNHFILVKLLKKQNLLIVNQILSNCFTTLYANSLLNPPLKSNQSFRVAQLLNNLATILGLSKLWRNQNKCSKVLHFKNSFLNCCTTNSHDTCFRRICVRACLLLYDIFVCFRFFFVVAGYPHPHHVPVVSLKEAQQTLNASDYTHGSCKPRFMICFH